MNKFGCRYWLGQTLEIFIVPLAVNTPHSHTLDFNIADSFVFALQQSFIQQFVNFFLANISRIRNVAYGV